MPVVLRRARELLVASTSLSIAAAAHLLAGGTLPGSLTGWTVVVALTLPVAVWTGRRRLTLGRVLPAMAVLQLVQHGGLSLMATADAVHGSPALGHAAPGHAALGHAAHLALGPGSLAGAAAPHAGAAHHAGAPTATALMLAAHVAAVALTAVALVVGDRAAAGVLAGLGAVALLVQGPPPFAGSRLLGPVGGRAWVPHARSAKATPRLRGPPRAAGAPA